MKEFLNALKPIFPVTYDLQKFLKLQFTSNAELFTMLVKIGIYLLAGIVVGAVLGLVGFLLPFLGVVFGLIGALVGIYLLAGIILTLLEFLKLI